MKEKFYSLDEILKRLADYNIIFGERSNGKSYSVLKYALEKYCKNGEQLGYIRRFDDDIKPKFANQVYKNLVVNGEITKLSKGKYNDIAYISGAFYLQRVENGEVTERDENPCTYAFALNLEERYKSTSYPLVTTILFDEFITRKYYLIDEFIYFTSILSTIIRLRDNVKIFMCGNTVNKFACPYFKEMGLKHLKEMKKGNIDVYQYGEHKELTIAVEYSDYPMKKKKSDKYFMFDNPKLKMITQGAWELDIYPHLPVKYLPKDVKYIYFINFDNELLQCEIIIQKDLAFTYIHRKTTPIKADNKNIVYQQEYDVRPNYARRINHPTNDLQKKICEFYVKEKIFYQDNEIGEIMRNYLQWCKM